MNMYSFYNTEEVAKKGDIKVYSTIFYATCHEKLLNSFFKKNLDQRSFSAIEHFKCGWSKLRRAVSVKYKMRNFPGGTVVKNLPTNAGDTGSTPGLGRSHMLQSN